eukprot:UN26815
MRNRDIYMKSKLRDYLRMVNFQMEDSLRILMRKNLENYHEFLIHACSATLKFETANKFEVIFPEKDSKGNNFIRRKEPLFLLDLLIVENQIVTTVKLDDCKKLVLNMFERSLATICNIPQIETLIMEHFYTRGGDIPMMATVQKNEAFVKQLYNEVEIALTTSLNYVQEYINLFQKYKKLLALDPKEYVEEFFKDEPNLEDIRKEI